MESYESPFDPDQESSQMTYHEGKAGWGTRMLCEAKDTEQEKGDETFL